MEVAAGAGLATLWHGARHSALQAARWLACKARIEFPSLLLLLLLLSNAKLPTERPASKPTAARPASPGGSKTIRATLTSFFTQNNCRQATCAPLLWLAGRPAARLLAIHSQPARRRPQSGHIGQRANKLCSLSFNLMHPSRPAGPPREQILKTKWKKNRGRGSFVRRRRTSGSRRSQAERPRRRLARCCFALATPGRPARLISCSSERSKARWSARGAHWNSSGRTLGGF